MDFALVDAVLEESGRREKRLRLLPSRVVVYFVLALALFEHCSYRTVWSKLTAALTPLARVRPAVSSLTRARRRVGAAPLRRLFETLAGPLARLGQTGSFYRGLRTVAVDGTLLHTPDDETLTWRYPKRAGEGEQQFRASPGARADSSSSSAAARSLSSARYAEPAPAARRTAAGGDPRLQGHHGRVGDHALLHAGGGARRRQRRGHARVEGRSLPPSSRSTVRPLSPRR